MTPLNMSQEQIENMIKLLQSMLPSIDNTSNLNNINDEHNDTNLNNHIKTKETKVRKTKKENLFDKMTEKNMHKQDTLIDKKLTTKPPVPRNRNFSSIEVTCRVCSKKENMPISLVQDRSRYKCNKCSSSPG